jgi:hypothetical protein
VDEAVVVEAVVVEAVVVEAVVVEAAVVEDAVVEDVVVVEAVVVEAFVVEAVVEAVMVEATGGGGVVLDKVEMGESTEGHDDGILEEGVGLERLSIREALGSEEEEGRGADE